MVRARLEVDIESCPMRVVPGTFQCLDLCMRGAESPMIPLSHDPPVFDDDTPDHRVGAYGPLAFQSKVETSGDKFSVSSFHDESRYEFEGQLMRREEH